MVAAKPGLPRRNKVKAGHPPTLDGHPIKASLASITMKSNLHPTAIKAMSLEGHHIKATEPFVKKNPQP
jgi:hypothetical protein